jgi:hypothetical protein
MFPEDLPEKCILLPKLDNHSHFLDNGYHNLFLLDQ